MTHHLTIDQLRDLFYMEDRLGITISITDTGSIQVPSRLGIPSYFPSLDEAYSYIKGYFDAASRGDKLPILESQ
jgi:hypothetical protein